jgi:putative transposase
MRKVPPSVMVREEINRTLTEGVTAGGNLLSTLAQLSLSYLVQQALEQEQEDFLGRGPYERQRGDSSVRVEDGQGEHRRLYRNGYEEGTLRTTEGEVGVRMPQVRGASAPYRSNLMEFLGKNSEALERLVVEMYARGLSTRDVEECFRDEISGELMISRSAVSEITDRLWEDYQEFCERDLSGVEVEYRVAGRRLRKPAPLRGQGGGLGSLVHHNRWAQGVVAPGARQQRVRRVLGRLFAGDAKAGLEGSDLSDFRGGSGVAQCH